MKVACKRALDKRSKVSHRQHWGHYLEYIIFVYFLFFFKKISKFVLYSVVVEHTP